MTQVSIVSSEQLADFKKLFKHFVKKYRAIKAENMRLRAVLIKYADRENWKSLSLLDRGDMARKILEDLRK